MRTWPGSQGWRNPSERAHAFTPTATQPSFHTAAYFPGTISKQIGHADEKMAALNLHRSSLLCKGVTKISSVPESLTMQSFTLVKTHKGLLRSLKLRPPQVLLCLFSDLQSWGCIFSFFGFNLLNNWSW